MPEPIRDGTCCDDYDSVDAQLERDRDLYGNAYYRILPDGTKERLDPMGVKGGQGREADELLAQGKLLAGIGLIACAGVLFLFFAWVVGWL